MNAERYARFVELCNQESCNEIELDEWSTIGLDIAREDMPELLDEVGRLQKIVDSLKECYNCKHGDCSYDESPCNTCRANDLNNWEIDDDQR